MMISSSHRPRIVLAALAACAALASRGLAVAAHAADCKSAGKMPVAVVLEPPGDTPIGGVKILLEYPAAVAIPGAADATSVRDRLKDLPDQFLTSPNDLDGSVRVSMASATATLGAKRIFTVDFDRCAGTPAPKASDFRCTVEEAAQDCAAPADGTTCRVTLP